MFLSEVVCEHHLRYSRSAAEREIVFLDLAVLQDEVAIKMVSRGVSNAKAAEREIANLRLCALHPYIIHMREVSVHFAEHLPRCHYLC